MHMTRKWMGLWGWVMSVAGGLLLLSGCDTQTQTAVENGVIDASSGLFAAFLQAWIQLAGETSSTAMILLDSAACFYA